MLVNHRIAGAVVGGVIYGIAFCHDEHPHIHEEYNTERTSDYLRTQIQTAPVSALSGVSGEIVSF